MARLLTCGFEENNLTATMWSSTVGTAPAVVTTTPHSGTYCLETSTASGNSFIRRTLSTNYTSGTHFLRTYFLAEDATPSANADIIIAQSNGAVSSYSVALLTTGAIRLTNNVTATAQTTSATLSNSTWYRIEIRHLLSDTVGEIELRLYAGDSTTATETLSITAEDTLATNVGLLNIGKNGTTTTKFWFDDFAYNDATGSFQTSWCGPGKICMLVPAAEGATIEWTPLSGTDNALMVDEMPAAAPDDATSYNATSTAALLDILTLTDMPAEVTSSATIALADLYGRVGGDATTGSPTMRFNIYDEADTKTAGPTCNKTDIAGWQIISTADHCVLDTAGKTKANLDSFKAGYEIVTDTAVEQRVTAVWMNVEWLEAVVGGAVTYPQLERAIRGLERGLVGV